MKIYETLDNYPSQEEINDFIKIKLNEGYKQVGVNKIMDDMETLEGKHPVIESITFIFEKL